MENHIADTFTDCLFEPSGDAAIVQLLQEAVLFVVQQVRKVILNNFLRKLLGKRLYAIPKRSVKIALEPALQGIHDFAFVLRLHLPKGNFSILSVVGIRNIEHIADTIWKVGAAQQGNTGGSPVYPATQPVPYTDFRTGGGIRALCVD